MNSYKDLAQPFLKYDALGRKVGNYTYIKSALGY